MFAQTENRREFLKQLGLSGSLLAFPGQFIAAEQLKPRPKVAVIFTSFFYRSHTHVLLENFLQPYLFNGRRTDPGVEVVVENGPILRVGKRRVCRVEAR